MLRGGKHITDVGRLRPPSAALDPGPAAATNPGAASAEVPGTIGSMRRLADCNPADEVVDAEGITVPWLDRWFRVI